jgi:hypothetical protein
MIGVIADDLTGAAEIGTIGLRHGLRAEIIRSGQAETSADIQAWTTVCDEKTLRVGGGTGANDGLGAAVRDARTGTRHGEAGHGRGGRGFVDHQTRNVCVGQGGHDARLSAIDGPMNQPANSGDKLIYMDPSPIARRLMWHIFSIGPAAWWRRSSAGI